MPKKAPQKILKVREYAADPGWCNVWLQEKDGSAVQGLLYGWMRVERAKKLYLFLKPLGIKLIRETCAITKGPGYGAVSEVPTEAVRGRYRSRKAGKSAGEAPG